MRLPLFTALDCELFEDGVHASFDWYRLCRCILPVGLFALESFNKLDLVFKIPRLSLAVHRTLLTDESEDAIEQRLHKRYLKKN